MLQIHLKLDLLSSLLLSINSPLVSFTHPSLPLSFFVFPFHLLELCTNSIQPNSIWSQYLERNHKVGYGHALARLGFICTDRNITSITTSQFLGALEVVDLSVYVRDFKVSKPFLLVLFFLFYYSA